MNARTIALHLLIGLVAAAPAARAQPWDVGQQGVDPPVFATTPASWGAAVAAGDFNGDSVSDLAVGAPDYDENVIVPNRADTGVVQVFFGSSGGFGSPAGSFYGSVANARKGAAVAAGDFDNNGVDELVFGEPGWSAVEDEAGSVDVRYWSGTAWPLSTGLRQGDDTPDDVEPFDHFGSALAVGDFDGDTYEDLAVGIPGENLEGTPTYLDAGAVAVFYGTSSGLNNAGNQFLHQGLSGLGGAQANARFGSSLAAGDFDGDGYDDLAIGAPFRDLATFADAGQVVVIYGTASGLSTSGAQVFDDTDLGGGLGTDDEFGFALAAGDFNRSLICVVLGSCRSELAIGIPGEPVSAQTHAGGVVIADSSTSGLVLGAGGLFFSQSSLDSTITSPEANDRMGSALAVGELDNRFGADLLVGVPEEDWGTSVDQGVVHLFFGGPSGLDSYPNRSVQPVAWWDAGPGAAGDLFGSAMAVGNFDGRQGGHGDVAIGLPGFDGEGSVQVLRGALYAEGFERGNLNAWSDVQP